MAGDNAPVQSLPKRSVAECHALLTAPGMPFEMDTALIDGRSLRVYKHQPTSVRALWLAAVDAHKDSDYVVFENHRYTYSLMHERATSLAGVFYHTYGIRKGDRVAIAMRNYPEFVIAFWATHLLGGIATLINAWSPPPTFLLCLRITGCKLVVVDSERAVKLGGRESWRKAGLAGMKGAIIVRASEDRLQKIPVGMKTLEDVLSISPAPLPSQPTLILPDDPATIFFTSGTTGHPKGVLSSQRSFIQNIFNGMLTRPRAVLRAGGSIEEAVPSAEEREREKRRMKEEGKGLATLLAVPLFHVTGCTGALMTATFTGAKLILMRKWDAEEAARLIVTEHVTTFSGVPSMTFDLVESSLPSDNSLDNIGYGGAPAAKTVAGALKKRFPGGTPMQGYGLTETNAIAATIAGEDYFARPTSTGLPPPTVDIQVVEPKTGKVLPPNTVGELWIRGSNIMTEYWNDPKATAQVITPDGWFKSGDLATMDEEGFVYIRDRVKDIIIRGGENIHSVTVENAIYADDRIMEVAVVSVPDHRLGELVAAIVSPKPAARGKVTEDEVIAVARQSLPAHAVPVLVMIQDEILRNANGKIMKDVARKTVREEWAKRAKSGRRGKLNAKL